MNNPSETLKEFIEVKFEHSESCGAGYVANLYRKYYMDKSEKNRNAHTILANEYRKHYWTKFHGETLLEKRQIMANHFGLSLDQIDEDFFRYGTAHLQCHANELYHTKYFKEIFEPHYFSKIKKFLFEYNPLFQNFNDIFILEMIIRVHEDKVFHNYRIPMGMYKNNIDLYGIFLHHAHNIIRILIEDKELLTIIEQNLKISSFINYKIIFLIIFFAIV